MSFQDECGVMAADVDSVFGVSITYTTRNQGTYNAATMERARGEVSTSITAIRGGSRIDVDASGGKIEVVEYSIKADQLAQRPQADDLITDTGNVCTVIAPVRTSVDLLFYDVTTARRL